MLRRWDTLSARNDLTYSFWGWTRTPALAFAATIAFISLPSAVAWERPAKTPPMGIPADATHFNGKWYRIYIEETDWDQANRRCTSLGGQLATVPDAPTWAFMKRLGDDLRLWLGGSDETTEGLWQWVDGSQVTFKAWHRRQPDNAGGSQHHIVKIGHGWDDDRKSAKHAGFICEWPDEAVRLARPRTPNSPAAASRAQSGAAAPATTSGPDQPKRFDFFNLGPNNPAKK